jgi:xanthine dehydrogenase YagS FAD-binding subunit
MRPFEYSSVTDLDTATRAAATGTLIAGGTTLVDLMKLNVMTPNQVIDITRLPLRGIRLTDAGGLTIGALETMADVSANSDVQARFPVIAQALLLSASAQLRNMASIGGNLMQRTRCPYFRDVSRPCNKRQPGSGCPALNGQNRMHAILGTSDSCCATHPSDLAVALVALGSTIQLTGPGSNREIPLEEFYLLPGETPEREHALQPGEIITQVNVPPVPGAERSVYLKIRDRASYEFALSSAAVILDMRGSQIRNARIAVGGVGTKPWTLPAVATALQGQTASPEVFIRAERLARNGARPLRYNAFKVDLLERTVSRALKQAANLA